ncbi:MAG: restriction endonuclease subunit S [Oscillospiraceae bacterium]|nr:restriction endonuclease subunit S [Oscillospiraceae bacterium]
MAIKTIDECFYYIQNGANIKQSEFGGGYPITRIETTSNDKFNRDRTGYGGIIDLSKYSSYVLEDGDLLMSHINSAKYLGRTVLYKKLGDEIIIHGMNLLRLKADRNVILPEYARYSFYSSAFRSQLEKITKKSVNQASFSVKDLKRIKLEIPEIEIQNKVVSNLNKTMHLIDLCNQIIEKLDLLIKAKFVEMFGEENFPIVSIADLVEEKISTAKKDFMQDSIIKYIDISSIDNQRNVMTGYTEYILSEAPSRATQHIIKGDIVISTVRPNLKNVAITTYDDNNLVASSGFCVLRAKKCLPSYLMAIACSNEFTDAMTKAVTGANYPAIKNSDIMRYTVLLPPIELQKKFEKLTEQIDKSKSAVKQVLEKAETLKKALMQEYFG